MLNQHLLSKLKPETWSCLCSTNVWPCIGHLISPWLHFLYISNPGVWIRSQELWLVAWFYSRISALSCQELQHQHYILLRYHNWLAFTSKCSDRCWLMQTRWLWTVFNKAMRNEAQVHSHIGQRDHWRPSNWNNAHIPPQTSYTFILRLEGRPQEHSPDRNTPAQSPAVLTLRPLSNVWRWEQSMLISTIIPMLRNSWGFCSWLYRKQNVGTRPLLTFSLCFDFCPFASAFLCSEVQEDKCPPLEPW